MYKLLLFLCLSFSFSGVSQTSKLIHGKVSYQDSFQQNIDVINYTAKKLTQTNTLGEFTIEAKPGDVLVFMSESFADQKYVLTAADFERAVLIIKLAEKPIPLQEVEIARIKSMRIEISDNDLKMAKIQKDQNRVKNPGVYTGEIENGMDFVQIGKMIGKLFKSNKPKPGPTEAPLPFKEYAKANFNETFFSKTLKLKPGETSRFLEFCEADPGSTVVIAKNDELAMLEFLLAKKTEFDKLK
jgi:hypothetical protein